MMLKGNEEKKAEQNIYSSRKKLLKNLLNKTEDILQMMSNAFLGGLFMTMVDTANDTVL